MNRRNFITDSIKAIAALTVAPLATMLAKDKEPQKEVAKGWLKTIELNPHKYKYEYEDANKFVALDASGAIDISMLL